MICSGVIIPNLVTAPDLTAFFERNGFEFIMTSDDPSAWSVRGKDRYLFVNLYESKEIIVTSEELALLYKFLSTEIVSIVSMSSSRISDSEFLRLYETLCEEFDGIFDIEDNTFGMIFNEIPFEKEMPLKEFLRIRKGV